MYKMPGSFKNAFAGMVHAIRTQRNMRIHILAGTLVLALGYFLKVSQVEFLFLFFAIFLVLTAEMFNTALEASVDLAVQEYHILARMAKNVAAGAVLIAAINSLVVAYMVFYPRLKMFLANLNF